MKNKYIYKCTECSSLLTIETDKNVPKRDFVSCIFNCDAVMEYLGA